jgi:hypothetical protein
MKLLYPFLLALISLIAPIIAFGDLGLVVPAGAALTIPSVASLDQGCSDLSIQGNTTLGSSQIQRIGAVAIGSSGVLNAGSATLEVISSWTNAGTFVAGSSTVVFIDECLASQAAHLRSSRNVLTPRVVTSANILGNNQFNNLSFISQTGRTFVIQAGQTITVKGTLTIQGTPSLPVQLVSSDPNGPPITINLAPGAEVVSSNAQIPPNIVIVQINTPPLSIPAMGDIETLTLIVLLMAMILWFHSGQQHPINTEQHRR